MTSIPTFEYNEVFQVAGRGTVYFGPSPFDDKFRTMTWRGTQVMVHGQLRTINHVEMNCGTYGPRKGTLIGIIFFEKNETWAEDRR